MASVRDADVRQRIRVVIGAQDIAQVREIYGHDVASSWLSMVGTVIVAKIKGGDTATFVAEELLGEQSIERITFEDGKRQPPHRERRLVMEPYELEDDLGPREKGIRALLIGFGDPVVIDWPYTDLPKVRKPSVPATWLNPPPPPPPPPSEVPALVVTPPKPKPGDSTNTSGTAQTTPPPPPRLKLRSLSLSELSDMASSGTDTAKAADDLSDLTDTAKGGNHEPN